jgi:hypothetical protein
VRHPFGFGWPPVQAQTIRPAGKALLLGHVDELRAVDRKSTHPLDDREQLVKLERLNRRFGIVPAAAPHRGGDPPDRLKQQLHTRLFPRRTVCG